MGVFIRRAALGCVLAVMMALALGGVAQAAWSPTAALNGARYNHTATLLDNGKVLVAGGHHTTTLSSAELYDPATGAWTKTSDMSAGRTGHAAVKLASGEVLVAGGDAAGNAERYNPGSNAWQPAGTMNVTRFRPTMTLLADGRVLVAGGAGDASTNSLKSAEIYDPADGSWTAVASMNAARQDATATLLPDGDVLVVGGWDGNADLSSAELYDPQQDKWTATDPLAEARDSATATALGNGDVLVAGGGSGPGASRTALTSAEVYDASAQTWQVVASMSGAREKAAAALLDDGTVLVTGGDDPSSADALATAEAYDRDTNTWSPDGPMTTARNQLTLTAVDGGRRAIAVGGNPAGFDIGLASVERFSSASTTLGNTEFGGVLVGTSSDVATATYTNTGKRSLAVTGVSITGASSTSYAVETDGCTGQTIASGATCEIGVKFTPAAAGNRSATLNVADDSTAVGSTSASLHGVGTPPPGSGTGAAPAGDGSAAAPGAGASPAAGGSTTTPGGAVLDTKASSKAKPARATCSTKTTRSHGRKRSTVTCKVTWPNGSGALTTRLMKGKKVVATTRSTAKAGKATLRLNAKSRLTSGRYTLVVAKRDGTVVLRKTIRVS